MRSFYRYLHRNEIVEANPARACGAPKLDKYLPGYLDRAQIDLLFQMAEARAWEGQLRGRAQPRDPRAVLLDRACACPSCRD